MSGKVVVVHIAIDGKCVERHGCDAMVGYC